MMDERIDTGAMKSIHGASIIITILIIINRFV